MTETDFYRPPEADLGPRRGPGGLRALPTVARVFIGLWGLFILAGPSRSGPHGAPHAGQIAAKALGATLFLVAMFPVRKPGAKAEPATEEL